MKVLKIGYDSISSNRYDSLSSSPFVWEERIKEYEVRETSKTYIGVDGHHRFSKLELMSIKIDGISAYNIFTSYYIYCLEEQKEEARKKIFDFLCDRKERITKIVSGMEFRRAE